jgi:hypothetical protein
MDEPIDFGTVLPACSSRSASCSARCASVSRTAARSPVVDVTSGLRDRAHVPADAPWPTPLWIRARVSRACRLYPAPQSVRT